MKRRACLGGVAIAALALAGCTPATIDEDAEKAWISSTEAVFDDLPGLVVNFFGQTTDSGDFGTKSHFSDGLPTVREAVFACFGADGETAEARWSVSGADGTMTGSQPLPCDGELHTFELVTVDDVFEASADVFREGTPRSFYAALVGDPASLPIE